MKTVLALAFACVFQFLGGVREDNFRSSYFNIMSDYRLAGHQITTTTAVSALSCAGKCQKQYGCKSCNYEVNRLDGETHGTCELNSRGLLSETYDPSLLYDKNFVFIKSEGCMQNINDVALGLGSGAIPNDRMAASSVYREGWEPWRGRLGHTNSGGCWAPQQNRLGEYLQVDLGRAKEIVKVATQGRHNADYWVTAFELSYSMDGSHWTRYQVNGAVKEFPGNWDADSIKSNIVSPAFKARYVRFYPTKYHRWMDLRAELYGCDA